MDLSQLEDLGKVGGVPGIAIGAAVLVLGAVLALPDTLPGPLLAVLASGALGLRTLAVVGWKRGREGVARVINERQ